MGQSYLQKEIIIQEYEEKLPSKRDDNSRVWGKVTFKKKLTTIKGGLNAKLNKLRNNFAV